MTVTEATIKELPMPEGDIDLAQVMVDFGWASSKVTARHLISQGYLRLDDPTDRVWTQLTARTDEDELTVYGRHGTGRLVRRKP